MQVHLGPLGVQVLHAQEPLGEGGPPELVLRLLGVLLNGIVVDVFVHAEGKGEVILYCEHVVAEDGVPQQQFYQSMQRIRYERNEGVGGLDHHVG